VTHVRTRRVLAATALAVALALVGPITAPAGAATARPNATTYAGAIAYNLVAPRQSPPGSNDWSCRPSAAHPRPVVLVHGTFANMTNAWQRLSPHLKNRGYCVFALDYGAGPIPYPIQGTADIRTSAAQLDAFVDQVRAATGAAEVDLVGHSQGGGITPRWYLKYLGGAAEVGRLVGLAPSNHGTTFLGLGSLARAFGLIGPLSGLAPSVEQQVIGSATTAQLDSGGDTVPGVAYTTIVSQYDEVVTPYTRQYLSGPNVTNIRLQAGCAIDFSEHLGVPYSPRALMLVSNALDPTRPEPVPCTLQVVP
jgi:triacylglycerol esterase/lipase EstA (alpha/beta hydrolase family)